MVEKNILIFGECGSGKSTLGNIIVEKEVFPISVSRVSKGKIEYSIKRKACEIELDYRLIEFSFGKSNFHDEECKKVVYSFLEYLYDELKNFSHVLIVSRFKGFKWVVTFIAFLRKVLGENVDRYITVVFPWKKTSSSEEETFNISGSISYIYTNLSWANLYSWQVCDEVDKQFLLEKEQKKKKK